MTEQEFIAKEQAKLDKKLKASLTKIEKTGEIGRVTGETLLINGLIILSRPRPGFVYNHYRLTELGVKTLAELKRKTS